MTPTQHGAFCQMCSKEVHDLSNSPLAEIRSKLFENPNERMCVRIKSSQLQAVNNSVERWYQPDESYHLRLFLFALFLVFGMSVFNGSAQTSSIAHELQEIHQVDAALTTATIEVRDSALKSHEDDFIHQGIRRVVTSDSHSTPEKPQAKVDTVHAESITKDPVEQIKFDIIAYPNPSRTETTLKISLPDSTELTIRVFSISGNQVRSYGTKAFPKGISEFTVDLRSLPKGTYLVGFQGAETGKAVSVVKL